ncbi:hypothetical protein BGZ98_006286 [Dissophora globulifera]|nr:hypothetical protein BGZ98_006286 [Dissophora globulifera]
MDSDDDDIRIEELREQANGAPSKALFSLDKLPSEFVAFLAKNEIDPAIYTVTNLPRYVRLNPDPQQTTTPEALAQELGTEVEPVPGLEAFCKLKGHIKLKNTQAYVEGRIFGMDLSSGIAVYALDIQPGDHVLDICCAPGAKLCMIAGLLTKSGAIPPDSKREGNQLRMDLTGTVTGIDISAHRLSTCRSLLKRHRLQQYVRLFQADGTTFGVMRPSAIDTIHARIKAVRGGQKLDEQNKKKRSVGDDVRQESVNTGHNSEGSFKRPRTSLEASSSTTDSLGQGKGVAGVDPNGLQEKLVPFYAPKILRNDPQLQGDGYKYDKVIVDAECTHDGSIAHILKYESWGWDSFHKNFMAQDRLESLMDLQRGLLLNGFRLTKPGGIVVYSTCSLSRAQNEDIIAWFLASTRGKAVLEPLPNHTVDIPTADCKKPDRSIIINALELRSDSDNPNITGCNNGASAHPPSAAIADRVEAEVINLCLRYDPIVSNTSGFFLARIRKLE